MCVLICAKVLSRCCCRSRMAPNFIFRTANMTIEANVIRLSRRHGLAACFFRLVRPTTCNMGQFGAKVLLRSCYCWRRAPSCTYKSADMSIEARVMRLSHRQGPAACLWRLLCPTTCHLFLVGRGSPKPRGTTFPTTEGTRPTYSICPNAGNRLDAPRAASVSISLQAALGVAVRPNLTILLLSSEL